jgi:hypothetical protein
MLPIEDQMIYGMFYSLLLKYPELGGNFERMGAFATPMCELDQFLNLVKPIKTNHDLIRVGGQLDGGYLIPDDLEGIETCFSPGVSDIANFESELTSRGIRCFLADYSVDAAPVVNPLFHFEKKYLGITNDSIYMTLENWVNRSTTHQSDFILQMDIEGNEYSVIASTDVETLQKFRIIAIEFHDLHRLCDKQGFEIINNTFRKLSDDFDIVHIHPNNVIKPLTYGKYVIPPLLEITFLRKDRVLNRQPATEFPHKLDIQNVAGEDLPLPACWYR